MEYRQNDQLLLATDFVQYTNANIFLTGKAGTGKTTFLHNLKQNTAKRMVVVAPTGVAAINAGGVTMHSFFQLSFGPAIPGQQAGGHGLKTEGFQRKFSREKIRLIKCIDLLVIDEISMVRADVLDAVDEVLRRYRNHAKPFGGVQLLMIGDLHQLSPVVREAEWNILKEYYPSAYFFESRALKKTSPVTIELKEIFRQSDLFFISLLNKVRENSMDDQTIGTLNTRYIPGFSPHEDEGYITLTTHNANAIEMNQKKLASLPGDSSIINADVEGEFPPHDFPNAEALELKQHAQVMFIKNDPSNDKQYYNGKIGKITRIEDETVYVKCPDDPGEIATGKVTWENIRYTLDETTKEIRETVIGSFTQVPLKLAWSITIHKSQGLTFDKVIIDANAAFAFGQVYVALSRCKTFNGIVLSTPLSMSGIKTDTLVMNYTRDALQQEPGQVKLMAAKLQFQQELVSDMFDFRTIRYRLDSLLSLLKDNSGNPDGPVLSDLQNTRSLVETTLFQVAGKFNRQMEQLMSDSTEPEQNPTLQERIRKAAAYFETELKKLMAESLNNIRFDMDNRAVVKLLNDALEKLRKEVFIRLSCLEMCRNGFETSAYLNTRSNAEVDFMSKVKQKTGKSEQPSRNVHHPELYDALRKWKNEMAGELNIPSYMVLPQKSLLELVHKLPTSPASLKAIKGMGQKKINRFGKDIIAIIEHFCHDRAITPDQVEIPGTDKKRKRR